VPLYSYKAINARGEIEEGAKNVPDQYTMQLELQERGLLPVKIELAQDKRFLGFSIANHAIRLSKKEILLLTRELATLLESGLPLDRSLQVLIQLTEDRAKLTKLVVQILESVKAGTSLADALENQTNVFSRFYLNMIRAGEMGGNLKDVLIRLADYLERSQELKETVTTALIYPAILLFMSLASLFVMLIFVVPQFTEMFENAGQALPLPTQIVIALAEGLRSYGWLILLSLVVTVSAIKRQWSEPTSKKIWDSRFLSIPLFGDIILQMETASLSRTLGTLLGNGVSILNALGIVRETASNLMIVDLLENAEQQLKQGKTISEALTDSQYFPKLATQMITMGEETGRLEDMLLRVADIYDKQLKTSIQRMLALLEPVLIITLGLIIAGIIVSILLAILSVNDLAF